ncbi:MAG: preprotein translocase subunit SecE [Clostridia bacterium]|nr:preprotein translocase subunit SecE [Clostridia bacterium]
MSEEKKTPAKNAEPSKGAKVLNWFKTLPQRIAKPFRNMYYELKKVTWPSKQRLISYSIIVLVFMLFMSVVIGLLDMGASAGVRSLVNATSSTSTSVSTAADTVEDAVEDAADEVADAVEDAAEEAAEAVEDAADAAEEAVEEAAETVEEAVEEAAEAVEEAAESATEAAEGN